MKDKNDKKTAELIPEIKKRGRPATGEAMTPAERKKAQRERDKKAIEENENLKEINTSAILESIGKYVAEGDEEITKKLCLELIKRAKTNNRA